LFVALPAALAGFVWLAGALVDPHYEAGSSIRVEATPEAVRLVLASIENYPRWRTDVAAVEITGRKPSPTWLEYDAKGRATAYAQTEDGLADEPVRERPDESPGASPIKWAERITGGTLPMRARRTFLMVPIEDGGTRIAVTEEGEIANPLERFRYRFQIGHTAALEKYLADLRKRLAE
jgi:hypothetical protein